MSGLGAADSARRVPRLAADCDPTRLDLSPAEGFLLSRIDGHTPQAVLRELGGLPPEEVDRCLERWAETGVVVFGEGARARAGSADAGLDSALDIDLEAQRAVLAMEERLERPYHEILGVPVDADVRSIKRAYFALSKQFHPDRYFRRNVGPYAERLERVFRKIAEAYELLSDPTTRAEIQRSLAPEAAPEAAPAEGGGARRKAPRRRRRMPAFSPMARALLQRRAKAKTFFEAGMASFAEGRWVEAAGSVRLAIAFDPHNESYRSRFAEVRAKAADVRFEQLMKEADSALTFRDRGDALRLFEDALHYKPYDTQANHTAAKLAWLTADDLRRAKEYAARACEVDPDNPEFRKTLGLIYKAAGLVANARRELQRASRLNPKDAEVRSELKSL